MFLFYININSLILL